MLVKCLSKKTVIKELHQHQTKKNTQRRFSPLLQPYVSAIKTVLCTVFSVHSTFYSPTTTQPCTIQHVSPCFKLQLHFIELKKGVLSVRSSGHTMRVLIKMAETGHRGGHRHRLIACSCRTQGIRKRRRRAGLCVRASIHSVCLKEEGIWDLPCQGQMKTERKTSPRAQAFRRRMEFNLISYEPCTFPLRLKAPGEGPMPSCDNSCLCQLARC